jgi:hypothetical protein
MWKLKYQGTSGKFKFYNINNTAAHIEMYIDRDSTIHIHSVWAANLDLELWRWFQQFVHIKAYTVRPEAISYWKRLNAEIVSFELCNFEDIVFEEGDFDEVTS